MPKGSAPTKKQGSDKSNLTASFKNSSSDNDSSEIKITYIRRTITIPNDLDKAINEMVNQERKKGNRESRSSIVEAALREYF